MNLSYDAKTIFFAARNDGGPWHIYEIGVDGKGLKQITDGASSDISPAVLPSGEIMFVSTRAGTRVVCQKQPSGLLYVCNRDGSNVRRVSGNTLSDHTPQVMNDGRVLFTRWDYGVDKNVFCRQNLWTMNPDGTRFALFGSNTKEDPNSFWEARAIPGRPEVVCVFGPHHSDHAGMIGLVWDRPVGFRKDIRGEGFRRDFEPVFNRRCMPCHKRHITPQTYNYNPGGKGQILVSSKTWNDIALSSFQLGHGRISMIGQIGPVHRINLTHPEWSQMLTAPLAKVAGGMGLCKASGGAAVFKDKADGDYKAISEALKKGHQTLMADPRVDMPEARKPENLEKARARITAADTWQRRSDNWISKNATYQASSIIPKWTTDKEKLLNGKPYDNDWAFCSENEASPYITITLDKAYAIDEVHIVNRVNSCQEFARTLTMWLSTDAKTWTKTWSAGGTARADWHVKLPETPKAKYIKLGLTETQYLDLKYVFIYGK